MDSIIIWTRTSFKKLQNPIFFKIFKNSFQWPTGIGLEPHQFFFEKNFGEVIDLLQLPIGRNFEYLEKNGVLQFFIRLAGPDDNAVHALWHNYLIIISLENVIQVRLYLGTSFFSTQYFGTQCESALKLNHNTML